MQSETVEALMDQMETPAEQPVATEAPQEATEGISEVTEAQEGTEGGIRNPVAYEKALSSERESRKALEVEVKKLRAEMEKAKLAELPEQERILAEAKAAGYAEAEERFNKQLFDARVVGAATAKNFHDPALALSLLDLPVAAPEGEISTALDVLAAERPYLVKQQAPAPAIAQGVMGDGPVSADDWLRNAAFR
jgi:hypothetical protein